MTRCGLGSAHDLDALGAVADGVHRRAADRGNALAQFYLGLSLVNGHGIPRDAVEGVSIAKKILGRG